MIMDILTKNNIFIHNCDCMEFMSNIDDKFFDIAIVDPPYGIGKILTSGSGSNSMKRFGKHEWDNKIPEKEYFNELFRVSKNQIIWGGNYFLDYLTQTKCFIVWDKMTYIPSMSQIELAWTSFNSHSKLVKINSNQKNRFHPTQKPIELYGWILNNYAKQGDKIFDSHLGSMSSVIAAYETGFEIHGCELDKSYFDKGYERVKNLLTQKLF